MRGSRLFILRPYLVSSIFRFHAVIIYVFSELDGE